MAEPQNGDIPDTLSAAELGMWQAFRSGSTYDLRARDPLRDDPFAPTVWGAGAQCATPGSSPGCC